MAQASKRKARKKSKPPDEPLEEELEETNGEEEEEVPLPDELPEEEPDLGRITMAEPEQTEKPAEKPAEERRGTASPAGVYRLGSTIDVPLTEVGPLGTGAPTLEEVVARQKEMADKIRALLGDDTDPEAVSIRGRLDSGNVDELEMAIAHTHLSDPANKEKREKVREAKEKAKKVQEKKEEEPQSL